MKIIVMDSANVRIEVLNVPDHMLEEDVEALLAEHNYSLNNISWMAAPIDYVPVQFHEYGICHSDGEELHFVREGKLKDFSIYDSVQEVNFVARRWMMAMSGTLRGNVPSLQHTTMTSLVMW